jgi:hypothetical protein
MLYQRVRSKFPNAAPRLAWRVLWWDWRGYHDWVGRRSLPKAGIHRPVRVKQPLRQSRSFRNRAGADYFVAQLRREIPEHELIVQVVYLQPKPSQAVPRDQFLPGLWPLQQRD